VDIGSALAVLVRVTETASFSAAACERTVRSRAVIARHVPVDRDGYRWQRNADALAEYAVVTAGVVPQRELRLETSCRCDVEGDRQLGKAALSGTLEGFSEPRQRSRGRRLDGADLDLALGAGRTSGRRGRGLSRAALRAGIELLSTRKSQPPEEDFCKRFIRKWHRLP